MTITYGSAPCSLTRVASARKYPCSSHSRKSGPSMDPGSYCGDSGSDMLTHLSADNPGSLNVISQGRQPRKSGGRALRSPPLITAAATCDSVFRGFERLCLHFD